MNTIRAGALQSRSIHPHSNQKHQHRSRHDSLHYQPHASIRHRLAYCLRHSACYVTLFRRPCETTPDPYQDATIHSMSPECMVQCQANPRHRVCPLSVGLRRALGHGAGPEARIRPPSQLFNPTSRRLCSFRHTLGAYARMASGLCSLVGAPRHLLGSRQCQHCRLLHATSRLVLDGWEFEHSRLRTGRASFMLA